MGIIKWLRRERVTVTTRRTLSPIPAADDATPGTIRTERYKRDLAEFQARRSAGRERSLPVSCTDCAAADADKTFSYERTSGAKCRRNGQHKRAKSASDDAACPNIQFLFQNQVFMPGNVFDTYTEPHKQKSRQRTRSPEVRLTGKRIEFNEDDQVTPLFYKNNILPVDSGAFLGYEEVDGGTYASSPPTPGSDKSCENERPDEMVKDNSLDSSRADDNKANVSNYGLPLVSTSDIDVNMDKDKEWNYGKWGVVPVQIKKLSGVSMAHVVQKNNIEIDILRKCRHPNIILLMALYTDVRNDIHVICERCVDSLFGAIHVQGRILSAQTAAAYAHDVAAALVFLRMRGYLHSGLSSRAVAVTARGAAKLADLGSCVVLSRAGGGGAEKRRLYDDPTLYANIGDNIYEETGDYEPLIAKHPLETYLEENSVAKPYKAYRESPLYRWQAPELFEPDDNNMVHVCSKSDVYALSLILWECCNASAPFKTLTYEQLKEQYRLWSVGMVLPSDGTYPGCLLDLLKKGLGLERAERPDIFEFADALRVVKHKLDEMDYIVIPARLTSRRSGFSGSAWAGGSSSSSEPSPRPHPLETHHRASSESDESKTENSPVYETIMRDKKMYADKVFLRDETDRNGFFGNIEGFSSACSTPVAKAKARVADRSPGLHNTGSAEFCSLSSPDGDAAKTSPGARPTPKLTGSFTPSSYKPLHIKVPELNFDTFKRVPKNNDSGRYNFDVRNYSLPSTPIARSNKLRKNAWLSGELDMQQKEQRRCENEKESKENQNENQNSHSSTLSSVEKVQNDTITSKNSPEYIDSPHSADTVRDSFHFIKRSEVTFDSTPEIDSDRMHSWSYKSTVDRSPVLRPKPRVQDEAIARVNVKPLVAIHEKWIYEANRKTERSMSLPDHNRSQMPAVKPASHSAGDALQKTLPLVNSRRSFGKFSGMKLNGSHSEQFVRARAAVARCRSLTDRGEVNGWTRDDAVWTKEEFKCSGAPPPPPPPPPPAGPATGVSPATAAPPVGPATVAPPATADRGTDTDNVEDFIKDLIRHELRRLLDDSDAPETRLSSQQRLSSIKIKGNNKPLLQIQFGRGESSVRVLDGCVSVTVGGGEAAGEGEVAAEREECPLKRCQTFGAIQEARSTEDLYIDDDLSTHMQENFGGKVRLIPLHGSLHELLCDRAGDCCLVKVKQEHGCDAVYFRCENSDTESGDAVDGREPAVLYKRSMLIEEKVERVRPRRARPHSEPPPPPLPLAVSRSSPALAAVQDGGGQDGYQDGGGQDGVEVNIEHAACDSSSDDASAEDDFETLEREMDELTAGNLGGNFGENHSGNLSGGLHKISEENLSVIAEDGEKPLPVGGRCH